MTLTETLVVLMSWAATLGGYDNPGTLPEVQFVDHAFFVTHACGGQECNVRGWYRDTDIVYIDERYQDTSEGYSRSLIVHEFTHYLQHKSGSYPETTCAVYVTREREARYVQQKYADTTLAGIYLFAYNPVFCNEEK